MMTSHIHAALIAEYAKDAAETDKPWERWEHRMCAGQNAWADCSSSLRWDEFTQYRRKPQPLCQVEEKDVFPGDKLWWKINNEWIEVTGYRSEDDTVFWLQGDGRRHFRRCNLSWTEPPKTKTVYQWAMRCEGTQNWFMTAGFFETEAQAARESGYGAADFRRLDWTALEVPE